MTDSLGCSSSFDQNITVDVCTGTNSLASDIVTSIYPNPAHSMVKISFNSDSEKVNFVELYNSAGQLTFEKNITMKEIGNSFELNISEMPSGIYFIKFITDSGSFKKKLVIQ